MWARARERLGGGGIWWCYPVHCGVEKKEERRHGPACMGNGGWGAEERKLAKGGEALRTSNRAK